MNVLGRVGGLCATLMVAGCMTIEPASTPADVTRIVVAGDLPEVSATAAEELVKASKVPTAILFTAKNCPACKAVLPDFWRTLRKSDGRFTGAILDTSKNQYFWKAHGAPELPAVIVFEKGAARWRVVGYDAIMDMRSVLLTNKRGYVHGLKTRTGKGPRADVRVFLVAANADSAAFAQEVVDQIAYWRRRGLRDDQIACYWSVPHFGYFYRDRRQFRRLQKTLDRCYQADLGHLMGDWARAAATKPEWLYLYVTAHGTGDAGAKRTLSYVKGGDKCPQLGASHLVFDSISGVPDALGMVELYDKACALPAAKLPVLTSSQLSVMLKGMPATYKTVVLQGCHSGGVVPKVLPARTTVLTAASPHRSSFGCNADGDRTVYGEEYFKALTRQNPSLTVHKDWVSLHDAVFAAVARREKELEIETNQRSLPMIFGVP